MSGFCMVTDNRILGIAAAALGTVMVFSWTVGLVSLRLVALRPVYWVVILMIPVAFFAQDQLLHRQILSCDAP
jgi:hypothetical protein